MAGKNRPPHALRVLSLLVPLWCARLLVTDATLPSPSHPAQSEVFLRLFNGQKDARLVPLSSGTSTTSLTVLSGQVVEIPGDPVPELILRISL